MSMVATAVVGGTIVGGLLSSRSQKKAASTAAEAQVQASEMGVEEQRRQFDAIQKLLKPYVDAGVPALIGQQNLIGLKGPQEQQKAIDALEDSPEFGALVKQGESAILQNASATGGLRGGNVQTALAKFRPSILSELINKQFDRLGGLTQVGQNSAVMQGNAGLQTGTNVANLFGQAGAANAGAALARGQANSNLFNTLGSAPALYAGMGGFGKF